MTDRERIVQWKDIEVREFIGGDGRNSAVFKIRQAFRQTVSVGKLLRIYENLERPDKWQGEAEKLERLSSADARIVPILDFGFCTPPASELPGVNPEFFNVDPTNILTEDKSASHAIIVTPFYPNGSVMDVLRRQNGVKSRQAVLWVHKILGAMAAVHRRGILHLDIKPSNVFLGHDRQPLLADFGQSKWRGPLSGIAFQRELYTSLIPPETAASILSDRGAPVSVQTDVYQVGALLLRLTAGDGVFCQLAQDYPPNSQEEAAALSCGSLLTTRLCQPHVPCSLRRVIAKAIHRRPESRYTDVLAFQNALAPIADLLDWRCSRWDTEGSEFVLDHNGRTESVVLHRRGGVWLTEGLLPGCVRQDDESVALEIRATPHPPGCGERTDQEVCGQDGELGFVARCPRCGRRVRRAVERLALEPRCRRCIAEPPEVNPPTEWRREGSYLIAGHAAETIKPDRDQIAEIRRAFLERAFP